MLIKGWVNGVLLEVQVYEQLCNIVVILFVGLWVVVMLDVYLGKGVIVGLVILIRGVIILVVVGVDIGCGMVVVCIMLCVNDLFDDFWQLCNSIECSILVGNGCGGEYQCMFDSIYIWLVQFGLVVGLEKIKDRYCWICIDKFDCQLGMLGGGNYFIELCLDEIDMVWVMLYSGLCGIGNLIGIYFIEKVCEELVWCVLGFYLLDKDLVFFMEGELLFDDYVEVVLWVQDYVWQNCEVMMLCVLVEMCYWLLKFQLVVMVVNCYYNYVQKEMYYGQELLVIWKGVVSVCEGELGIIFGSMGMCSYIVCGKGNVDSFYSCSYGVGWVMSCGVVCQQIMLVQYCEVIVYVECCKDSGVLDELLVVYKLIDDVMVVQLDLVDVVYILCQVLCVKG